MVGIFGRQGTEAMPLFLLVLGIVTTVAGLGLVASGWAGRDGTFETEILTPGTIAAVGGLLLVGLSLAVRELRRIERALAARLMPAPARAGDGAAVDEAPEAVVRLPFPPQAKAAARPLPPAAATAAATEGAKPERSRTNAAPPARGEGEQLEGVEAPLVLPLPAREEAPVEVSNAPVGRRASAAAPARVASRPGVKSGPDNSAARAGGFGLRALWPQRSRQNGQTAAASVTTPRAAGEPEASQPPGVDAAGARAVPVSVLKSGNVEGMAYTLYSDGSIEAQLPQGTVRFGSISALRQHIESTA